MYQLLGFGNIAVFIGTLFVSIVLHEMMHAFVAYKLGDDLAHSEGRISLNPLNHIDPLLTIVMPLVFYITTGALVLAAKPVPINTSRIRGDEYGFALVGLAGPMTNLALALLGGGVIRLVSEGGVMEAILLQFIIINIGICAFNLLPIPPLDGSRVLYAFAPEPVRNVMRRIEQFGIFGLLLIIFLLAPVIYPFLDVLYDAFISLVNIVSGGKLR